MKQTLLGIALRHGIGSWLLFLSILVCVTPRSAHAIDTEFTAQVRWRLEVDDRDFNNTTVPRVFSLQRTRFGARFTATNHVSAFLVLQDSRTWGEEITTFDGSADQFDLYQGYFTISNMFDRPLSLDLGRKALIYGNERLVGAVGWSNLARSYDGAVLRAEGEAGSVDLFATTIRASARFKPPAERNLARYFFGGYGRYDWTDDYSHTDAYLFYDLDNDTIPIGVNAGSSELNRATIGVMQVLGYAGLDLTVEGAYQFGSMMAADTTKVDVSAWFAAVNAWYKFSGTTWKPWIGAGVDVLSGDDPASKDFGAFRTLFATNHKFYGYMDYFPLFAGSLGLRDYMIKARVNPTDFLIFAADFHRFDRDQKDSAGQSLFGYELDLTLKSTRVKHLGLMTGYSFFIPEDVFKSQGLNDTSHWFYVMATASL
jgi:hypothetical protein